MNNRVLHHFRENVVRKATAREPEFRHLPLFVTEYLLAKFAPSGNKKELERLKSFVQRHCAESAPEERVWDQVKLERPLVLVGKLTVAMNRRTGRLDGQLSALGEGRLAIPFEIADRYPQLFYGAWGTVGLAYHKDRKNLVVEDFVPIQVPGARLDAFLRGRMYFNETRWIDLLLQSLHVDPASLSEEAKHFYLLQLAPLVDGALPLLYRTNQSGSALLDLPNMFPQALQLRDPETLEAGLHPNPLDHLPGMIHTHSVIVLDPLSDFVWTRSQFHTTLLEDLRRTAERANLADASLALVCRVRSRARSPRLPLPEWAKSHPDFFRSVVGLAVSANDGQPAAPYDGPALALDYLAEMFARLRREPWKVDLDKFLPDSLDITDEQAVRRLVRALLKLVYPAGDYPPDAVARWTRVALQCREALYDEASRHRPDAFPPRAKPAEEPEPQPEPPPAPPAEEPPPAATEPSS